MMMIIRNGKHRTTYLCPSRTHDQNISCGTIPEYYSVDHAKDAGWLATSDIKFCPPEEEFVWVCPECAAKYAWHKLRENFESYYVCNRQSTEMNGLGEYVTPAVQDAWAGWKAAYLWLSGDKKAATAALNSAVDALLDYWLEE